MNLQQKNDWKLLGNDQPVGSAVAVRGAFLRLPPVQPKGACVELAETFGFRSATAAIQNKPCAV